MCDGGGGGGVCGGVCVCVGVTRRGRRTTRRQVEGGGLRRGERKEEEKSIKNTPPPEHEAALDALIRRSHGLQRYYSSHSTRGRCLFGKKERRDVFPSVYRETNREEETAGKQLKSPLWNGPHLNQ